MPEPFSLPYVQDGLVEVLLLAVAAAAIGTWVVLRGLAFYAHAVGTAAFPGVVLAEGIGFSPVLGAFGVAIACAGALEVLRRRRAGSADSVTALVLVAALAAGVVLASDVFSSPGSVDSLLFGSLLLIDGGDLALAAAVAAAALAGSAVAGRVWLATGFDDPGTLRLRARTPDLLLYGLIALASVAAVAAVGALMTTAILLVPAATARLHVRSLRRLQLATFALAAVEGVAGLWLAVELNVPPGATIAVLAGCVFALAVAARAVSARRRAPALAVAVLALVVAACGGADEDGATPAGGERPSVVATTTVIADWARAVGGDAVDVHGILAPNSDPHEYEPRPDDVAAVAGADVVLANGDGLDHWIDEIAEEAGGVAVTDLAQGLPQRLPGEEEGEEASEFDPHWWPDPRNARHAVEAIRDAIAAASPDAADVVRANADAYLARLDALDAGIASCLDAVPPRDRRLVSDHDAFGYLASRYGIDVVGAVIPSQSTTAQPSAGDLAALADVVRREGVRAIFPEESLSPELAEQVARETGARADLALYGDGLGEQGSSGATYLGMMAANADALVRGFTGDAARCTIPGIP